MNEDFLGLEAKKQGRQIRKNTLILLIVISCLFAFLYFATKGEIDLNNEKDKMLSIIFVAGGAFILFCTLFLFIKTSLPVKNGKNLILPLEERDKPTAAEIINREAADGKIQFEKTVEAENTVLNGKYPERMLLLPTYLLICHTSGMVTAIPRSKIYWLGVKTAYRRNGDFFYVKLLVFTEKKIIEIDGNNVDYTRNLANELYRYIPNVFKNAEMRKEMTADEFVYFLEQLYIKNRAEFLEFYNNEKKKNQ